MTSKVDTLDVYLDMIAMVPAAAQRHPGAEQAALERERTTRDREALVLQMFQDMQHRYDRLLDLPRGLPRPPSPRVPQDRRSPLPRGQKPVAPPTPSGDARGAMRRHIVALLQDHPEDLTAREIRDMLGIERNLADTLGGMLRYGLVQRVERGRIWPRHARGW